MSPIKICFMLYFFAFKVFLKLGKKIQFAPLCNTLSTTSNIFLFKSKIFHMLAGGSYVASGLSFLDQYGGNPLCFFFTCFL